MPVAVVIPFHRYAPYVHNTYEIIFRLFLRHSKKWKDTVNTLHFIDSNNFLTEINKEKLIKHFNKTRVQIDYTHNFSHAENMAHVFPLISDDVVLFMDMDTVVYKSNVVEQMLIKINHIGFDMCGFIEKPDRKTISRFAPYFSMFKMETLRRLQKEKGIDFEPHPPEHLDPFAKMSHDLLSLTDPTVRYNQIFDDRATCQMKLDGEILQNPDQYDYQASGRLGVYHLRNFHGGIHLIDMLQTDRAGFEKHVGLIPAEELSRLMGWLYCVGRRIGEAEPLFANIREIVAFKGFDMSRWELFVTKFYEYHKDLFEAL